MVCRPHGRWNCHSPVEGRVPREVRLDLFVRQRRPQARLNVSIRDRLDRPRIPPACPPPSEPEYPFRSPPLKSHVRTLAGCSPTRQKNLPEKLAEHRPRTPSARPPFRTMWASRSAPGQTFAARRGRLLGLPRRDARASQDSATHICAYRRTRKGPSQEPDKTPDPPQRASPIQTSPGISFRTPHFPLDTRGYSG